MKYSKKHERGFGRDGRGCYRVLFRTVFASHITDRVTSVAADINTGASHHHIFDWNPKKCIQRNYKMIFRSYRAWGVDG